MVAQASMVRAFNFATFIVSMNVVNFVTFSIYAGTGNAITAKNVFTFISLISFARLHFMHSFVTMLLCLQEMRVGVQRIQVNQLVGFTYALL